MTDHALEARHKGAKICLLRNPPAITWLQTKQTLGNDSVVNPLEKEKERGEEGTNCTEDLPGENAPGQVYEHF